MKLASIDHRLAAEDQRRSFSLSDAVPAVAVSIEMGVDSFYEDKPPAPGRGTNAPEDLAGKAVSPGGAAKYNARLSSGGPAEALPTNAGRKTTNYWGAVAGLGPCHTHFALWDTLSHKNRVLGLNWANIPLAAQKELLSKIMGTTPNASAGPPLLSGGV